MFVYNLKVNGGIILRIIIIVLSLFMLIVFGISVYRIFFSGKEFFVNDTIAKREITEIDEKNYTNILQAVHENIDNYTGIKIKFIGYIYRVFDFSDEQFVIARDMFINDEQSQSVVVGFLCNYKDANKFEDGTWVELIGTIEKGKYHNSEIPIIKVIELNKTSKSENPFVPQPSNTYIPTIGIL